MSSYETILIDRDGPSFVITLNRPKRKNAFSKQLMGEVVDACKEAEQDSSITAVIITGGMDYFSAGADLNEAMQNKTAKQTVDYIDNWLRLNRTVEYLRKPVIAAIEGFCLTGGWEFAMACDVRIAVKNSTFALTSARIGTVPGAGGTQRLLRQVGVNRTLDILFKADPIDAEHALRIGAIEYLVENGQALAKAKELVAIYAQRAPLSLAYCKRVVRGGAQMDQESALEFEQFVVAAIYSTEDKNEGIGAFLEKRKAVFKGQ